MPIYEYKCAGCGHQGEHLQKVSETPLTKCPSCGKKKYRKQISAAGFQLKGSGWYATDFKSKPSGKKTDEKKADTKAEAKTESKSEKSEKSEKTEKKSESKSESKAASTATTN